MMKKYNEVDDKKVEIAVLLYIDNWDTLSAFDQDVETVEWHVTNCMTYITQLSEGLTPIYRPPPDLRLDPDDWNDNELLTLYRDIAISAVKRGYECDPGMLTRIKQTIKPKRVAMRRYVRP